MSENSIQERGATAKNASFKCADTSTSSRNHALNAIADALDHHRAAIKQANASDIKRSQAEKLAAPLLKRLAFDDAKIDSVIQGIRDLIVLDDPIGQTKLATELDTGLDLYRVTCPIGVIGIIFESRPDAFVQISVLCLKSGNAVLLKGGREALETNRILYQIISNATAQIGYPDHWIQNLESREDVSDMLALDDTIDLIIPRGSNAFVRYIMEHTNIPVMGHSEGLCHVYIDASADPKKAIPVAVDAKSQSVAVCNAEETLLIHESIAPVILPPLKKAMDAAGVHLRGDLAVRNIIDAEIANDSDWQTEYLDYILSIKIVKNLSEAIDHINHFGSGHTDVIVTEDLESARKFTAQVDSAGVFVNCSSRFADGFRYGFGAEVGISTAKLHARGPVGLDGLVSYKYKLLGHGQIVEDYENGSKHFTHRPLHQQCPL
ncbi:MAG: glutamate-5-semialdehyde dehydrogenase [Eubacteriaceae bacterium]|jgi:glutamate-5-semialdehyde dehydrogenase|nr:glutamate-5-semialdehyde dehydrogenase [Eubacteriaceae bacterium]MDD4508152.1 glutamate-5-semialdehyde dehydrogenase [Eubacteriaceae bacterium]